MKTCSYIQKNFDGSIPLGWLELSSGSLQVILCIIHPGWLELPLARTVFHGSKPVPAIEVLLYMQLSLKIGDKVVLGNSNVYQQHNPVTEK